MKKLVWVTLFAALAALTLHLPADGAAKSTRPQSLIAGTIAERDGNLASSGDRRGWGHNDRRQHNNRHRAGSRNFGGMNPYNGSDGFGGPDLLMGFGGKAGPGIRNRTNNNNGEHHDGR